MGHAGFTLVELMVVVAVVGILATLAIPSYLQWKPGYAYRGGISQVRGDLHKAKLRAFEIGREIRFQICGNGVNYQLIDGDKALNSSWDNVPGALVFSCPMSADDQQDFKNAGREVTVGNFDDYPEVTVSPAGFVDFTPRGLTKAGGNFDFNVLYKGQSSHRGQSGAYRVSVAGRIKLL